MTTTVPYTTLEARINRYRVRDVLEWCNRLANWVDQRSIEDWRLPLVVGGRRTPYWTTVTPWCLALLAKTSLLRSNDNRQRQLDYDGLFNLVNVYNNLDDAFAHNGWSEMERFFLRTAWEQFPYQESKRGAIPRIWALLTVEAAKETRDLDVGAAWEQIAGMSLRKFLQVGFGYLAGAMSYPRLHPMFPSRGALAGLLSEGDCEAFLRTVACTYEEFRELQRPYRVDDPVYTKTEFNYLVRRPLIWSDGELICPVPRLLLARLTTGVLFDLVDHFKKEGRNPFSEYFGRLFELYTGSILRRMYGEECVHEEPKYGSPERRGPDWVVIQGEDAILFECRSSRLSLEAKTVADQGRVLDDTKRIFADTANRYRSKIEDLRSGAAGINTTGVQRYWPVIVTWEPLYVGSLLRSIAQPLLDDDAEFLLVSISDLEISEDWPNEFRPEHLFGSWIIEYVLHGSDYSTFLGDFGRKNGLSGSSMYLDRILDEFFVHLFGPAFRRLTSEPGEPPAPGLASPLSGSDGSEDPPDPP
jgi:hypothetical protein